MLIICGILLWAVVCLFCMSIAIVGKRSDLYDFDTDPDNL